MHVGNKRDTHPALADGIASRLKRLDLFHVASDNEISKARHVIAVFGAHQGPGHRGPRHALGAVAAQQVARLQAPTIEPDGAFLCALLSGRSGRPGCKERGGFVVRGIVPVREAVERQHAVLGLFRGLPRPGHERTRQGLARRRKQWLWVGDPTDRTNVAPRSPQDCKLERVPRHTICVDRGLRPACQLLVVRRAAHDAVCEHWVAQEVGNRARADLHRLDHPIPQVFLAPGQLRDLEERHKFPAQGGLFFDT